MVDPRRVPWAFASEIQELYDLLYSPAADAESHRRALSRISVYLASPSVPLFMPLLHSLISSALLPYPPQSSEQAHSTRLSYAMSLVRFVNGMVDPLQTGPFARPISHLAATLHIPPSLISLRHRATHEDLPPIEALHASVHLALDYLHASAFVPLLAPSEDAEGLMEGTSVSGPVDGLIKRWKKVMKERIREREVGNGGERGREVRNLKREFAEVGADAVDGLVAVGGLVPLARKKRPSAKDTYPPPSALQLWEPLLTSLQTSNSTFPHLLTARIITVLLSRPADFSPPLIPGFDIAAGLKEHEKEIASYRHALVTWIAWIWDQDNTAFALSEEEKRQLSDRIIKGLVGDDVALRRLVGILQEQDAGFAKRTQGLVDVLQASNSATEMDVDDAIATMENRLAALKQMLRPTASSSAVSKVAQDGEISVPGWTRVDVDWKPTPIGVWSGPVRIQT